MSDKTKTILFAIGLVVLGTLIGASLAGNNSSGRLLGGGGDFFYADAATTTEHGSAWLTTSASELIYTNSKRQFAEFRVDKNSTNTAYLWQATSTDLVTVEGGIVLNATTSPSYRINGDNLYRGDVQGIADGDVKIYWIAQ